MVLIPFFLWRLFFLALSANFALAASDIVDGQFNGIGLPPEMLTMEAVANGLEAFGWLVVFALSWTSRRSASARMAVFLGGFLFFDVITTFVLPMPLPPYFLVWGTVLVVVQLLGARYLFKEDADATNV